VHVAGDRSSVLLWQRCDTLCTSGFVDDILFLHNGYMAAIQYNSRASNQILVSNELQQVRELRMESKVCYL